jgi:hypothetical protein
MKRHFLLWACISLIALFTCGCRGYVGKAHVFNGRCRLVETELSKKHMLIPEDDRGIRLVEYRDVEWDIEQQFNTYRCNLDYHFSDDSGELLLFLICGFSELPDPTSSTRWKTYYFENPPDIPYKGKLKLYYTAPGASQRYGQFFTYPFIPGSSIGSTKSSPPVSARLTGSQWKSMKRTKNSTRKIPLSHVRVVERVGGKDIPLGESDVLGYCEFLKQNDMQRKLYTENSTNKKVEIQWEISENGAIR